MRAVLLVFILAACGKSHCKEVDTNITPGALDISYKGCSGGDHKLHCATGAQMMCTCDGHDFKTASQASKIPDDVIDKECGFTP